MQGYKIHVVKTAVQIIKEFKNYVWQKDRHGNYTDVPVDKFNHLCDAIRYVCMMDRSGRGTRKSTYKAGELGL